MSDAKPTVFTHSNDEGRERVNKSRGKYAFFMESTSIEYYIMRNCKLKMLGSKLDSKEYGIAMAKSKCYLCIFTSKRYVVIKGGVKSVEQLDL